MKSLVYGCAAAALLMGLALQAQAEIVRDAPIHTVPADDDGGGAPAVQAAKPDAAPAAEAAPPAVETPAAAKAEPAAVQALVQPKAPPQTLTPEENAFFAVLGQRVTDAASAYESYVRRAGAIDPAFSSAASVQRAVTAGAAYHPVQLEEGVIAYAALVALRDQAFVDGVRAIQNPAFADDLAGHPELVLQVRGAPAAGADVAGVLQAQGETLIAEGKAITKAAYDIQAQAWSKSPVVDPKGVLDGAKTSAEEMRVATTPSKEKLLASLVAAPQAPSAAAPSADVERGLALAALAILGKTGDGAEARYEALLHDSSSEDCLKLAKLNLNQCLAVAGPHYEDVYCAGRHAVSDTGKCVSDAAGGPADIAAPAPRLQEAEVPKAEVIGPEQAAVYGKTPTVPAEDADDDAVRPAAPAPTMAAAAPALAPAPAPTVAPVPAPALADAAPAPAPAPRQYAEAPLPYAQAPAEPMPDPRLPRQVAQTPPPAEAPAYAPPQPYSYAQNDYAAPQPPPAQYARQAYAQPQYQASPYPQPYPQAQYAPQPYPQPPAYQQPYAAPTYQQPAPAYAPSAPQPYYPQNYPTYQGGYYGR